MTGQRSHDAAWNLRYEIKLVGAAGLAAQMRLWMRHHPAGLRVAYPPRCVNNIYLDTPALTMLTANLDGLSLRNKLRLRWYGEALTVIHPHLELKHKDNLLGSKAQTALPCSIDLREPWSVTLANLRAQDTRAGLAPSWNVRLQAALQPTLLNRYLRNYYVTPDNAVRVTLDTDQTAYDQRFQMRPNIRCKLPIRDLTVIEIKADRDQAHRVQEIANAFPISRSRNSKYAKGMLAALYSQ